MLKNENATSFMKKEQVNNRHSSELELDVPILIGNQIYRFLPFDELHPLAINRIISVFDVMSINRKHVKSVSVNSYDENNEVGIKFNYNF